MAVLSVIVPPRRRWLLALLLWLGAWQLAAAESAPAPAPGGDYPFKAGFLFNFAQFVEWPATAFAQPASPIVIGVLGDDPFGAYLDEVVRGERVSGRPLQVQRFRRVEDIQACHILFIAASERERMDAILAALDRRSILTVGDTDNFSHAGGVIRLVTENGKIRLRINHELARQCQLTISSKILRAATIVTKEKG